MSCPDPATASYSSPSQQPRNHRASIDKNQAFGATSTKGGLPLGKAYDSRETAGLERDYERMYPDTDMLYQECDDDARVWHVYNQEAVNVDHEMLIRSGDALDVLLIFGALFSAVITTFVSQTSSLLPRDNASLTVDVLVEVAQLLRAQMNGTDPATISSVDSQPTPEATNIVWVNGLWLTSLVLSLATALFSVLAKQWLRHYSSPIGGSTPRERALIHQYRYMGFDTWGVSTMIGLLPTLLHLSLLLFLGGLVLYLQDLHYVLARAIGGLSLAIATIYTFFIIVPIFITNCPYRVPLTDILRYLFIRAYIAVAFVLIAIMSVWIHLIIVFPIYLWNCYTRSTDSAHGFEILSVAWDLFFGGVVPIFKAYSKRNWAEAERQGAREREKTIVSSAVWWLCVATSNVSAQRIARQAIGAVPNLSPQVQTLHRNLWSAVYENEGPLLNHTGYTIEELHRQAERWVRSWTRLGCPSLLMLKHSISPMTVLGETNSLSQVSDMLTLEAARNTAPMADSTESATPVQRLPPFAHLLRCLEHWKVNECLQAPRFLWKACLTNFEMPKPGTEPSFETDTFLDFAAKSGVVVVVKSAEPKEDTDLIPMVEALCDSLKQSSWFDDPRVVGRMSALRAQNTVTASPHLTSSQVALAIAPRTADPLPTEFAALDNNGHPHQDDGFDIAPQLVKPAPSPSFDQQNTKATQSDSNSGHVVVDILPVYGTSTPCTTTSQSRQEQR